MKKINKVLSVIIAAIFALQVGSCCLEEHGFSVKAVAQSGGDLYVSKLGNDNWSGKLAEPNSDKTDGPLATVEAAKKKMAENGANGATVWLREGTYLLNEPLSFTSQDASDITYRAYNGEKAVISGGMPIDNWTAETINQKNVWTAEIDPDMIDGEFNSLYSERGFLQNTRLPETGFYYTNGADIKDADNTDSEFFTNNKSFYYKSGDIKDFYNIDDVTVRIYHFWYDEMTKLSGVNKKQKKAYLADSTLMTVKKDDAYFLENVKEALDKPGEWYIDRKLNKLYYIPFENETMDSAQIFAGRLKCIINAEGADSITFKDVKFENTNWNMPKYRFPQAAMSVDPCIHIKNCDSFNFEDCEFVRFGSACVKYDLGSRNCLVKGCNFHEIGANAVVIAGNCVPMDSKELTKNITVTENHIYHYGLRYAAAVGVLQTYANSCEISHNEIHGGSYTGISVGWTLWEAYTPTNNNLIADNLIYDIGHDALSDMGGIYTLGEQPGTVISGNIVSNVAAGADATTYGGWGIYLDEGSAEIDVRDNLVYGCDSQGFHQHYGRENRLHNNIFALNKDAQVRASRIVNGYLNFYLYGNILVGDNQPIYNDLQEDEFVDDRNMYFDFAAANGVVYSGNHRDADNKKNKTIDQVKEMGYYNNAVFANPGFIDPENGNFGFTTDKAEKLIGFSEHDFSNVGSAKFASSYLVNRLPKSRSCYPTALWNSYKAAEKAAKESRNEETISALISAYNALESYSGDEVKTVENSSQWTSSDGASISSLLSVSGVQQGTDFAVSNGDFDKSFENHKKSLVKKTNYASSASSASAVYYADRSLYSDMSQTPLRICGGISDADAEVMSYFCSLQGVKGDNPSSLLSDSTISSGIRYSLESGGRKKPFIGTEKGKAVSASEENFGIISKKLEGRLPAADSSAKIRITGRAAVRSENSDKYYSVDSYIDLTIIGVDKTELRSAVEKYSEASLAGGNYSPDDYEVYMPALQKAREVTDGEGYSQAEIDAAAENLITAYRTLTGESGTEIDSVCDFFIYIFGVIKNFFRNIFC